ncbi:MAG: CRISPR-associated helicase Cas3' [Planctomycetia bacterium]|nr:CRISPR-associated helicase Cas3' [Planctomycetia bacterium]
MSNATKNPESSFESFFRQATGTDPYPYQSRFATADDIPHLIQAPTGAGKTATAILGWLYRRQQFPDQTPRRLVYCLPMRVLVEQSEREAMKWIENLKLAVPVHVLMGGADTEKWYLQPEVPAVLIGTQDMLLSRALNRGYAASRFHWPIDFALLNNDSLWVFDEPQLMAGGVSTSSQLAGLRKSLDVYGSCPSVWMSATLEPDWLDTIDFAGKFPAPPLELTSEDYDPQRNLYKRMTADKTLRQVDVGSSGDMRDVAKRVWELHQHGTQTLVVVNVVERAKAVYRALQSLRKKSEAPALLLVHSRFRPHERKRLNDELQRKDAGNRIIVATQVVEAGVDISARTLITELAPWASIVQRAGRCNRTGDDGPGTVYWIDLNEKLALPYEATDIDFARQKVKKLEGQDVSPRALEEFKKAENLKLPFEHKHVLRRRDLLDLFDTSPDLSGNDIDIARFVRSDDPDTDVQVFWREWSGDAPPPEEPRPARAELCSVPIMSAKKFLETLDDKRGEGYIWDHLSEEWVPVAPRQVRPGMVIMLPTTAGGYAAASNSSPEASEVGWDPTSMAAVESLRPANAPPEDSAKSDPESVHQLPNPLSVAQHTNNVCAELELVLASLPAIDAFDGHLAKAARWHDAGKAHATFQEAVRKVNPSLDAETLWAKSGKKGKLAYRPPYFRHELASALAALRHGLAFEAAYLIAAHHGKVRLSIRSLPDEELPDDGRLFALGVGDGDTLPEVDLGDESCPATELDLTPMRLGGESSWTGRALKLLAELGPFRLAYLETLLRTADVRASRKEAGHA